MQTLSTFALSVVVTLFVIFAIIRELFNSAITNHPAITYASIFVGLILLGWASPVLWNIVTTIGLAYFAYAIYKSM